MLCGSRVLGGSDFEGDAQGGFERSGFKPLLWGESAVLALVGGYPPAPAFLGETGKGIRVLVAGDSFLGFSGLLLLQSLDSCEEADIIRP
jgi:hypothetical protein